MHAYPVRLTASLHETLWGGRKLDHEQWKKLPEGDVTIGEAWETEISTLIENGPERGKALGTLVNEWGAALLGKQAMSIFGPRFPLLAKFIDAHAHLSVQVHPNDAYANRHESGKLGKTEAWYILAAEPGAKIVYGFAEETNKNAVESAIERNTLEGLLHEELVFSGDVVFVPAGTIHAIGEGVLLYELQEYSDVTYRMYDYGRRSASGKPRELHIRQSLDVANFEAAHHVKSKPVHLAGGKGYEERCLVACRYFLIRELMLKEGCSVERTTADSCIILSSIGANLHVRYGADFAQSETLVRGQTMVLPATLGSYRIEGDGSLLFSYVPTTDDDALLQWQKANA